MVNMREQVANALIAVNSNVKMTKPDGDVELPLICYSEVSNTVNNAASVRIKYRVAVYANTFEELVDIVNEVDNVMTESLGFTRTGKSPDGDARKGTDFYLIRLDYSALVNTIMNYVVRGSV